MSLLRSRILVAFAAITLAACHSIEGTRDKSQTVERLVGVAPHTTIAISPIKAVPQLDGLSDRISAALPRSLGKILPAANIDGPRTVTERLSAKDLLGPYSQWAATYEMTTVLDPRPLKDFRTALNADYLLFVHSVVLGRERIRAVETGYSGFVSNANNVWRTDLKISALLVELGSGQIVWKGQGHAENINSPLKTITVGFVAIDQRNPEMLEYVDKLVAVATEGLGRQLAGLSPIAGRR